MLVLDVCCGAAHAAEVVAPRVRQVVGIDLTVDLLRLGAARLAAAGVGNVLLQEGNAQALPFVAGSFDLVYCFASLHHVGDPGRRGGGDGPRARHPAAASCCRTSSCPFPIARDRFDDVHRRLDPSHRRAFLEAELVDAAARRRRAHVRGDDESRFPISIAYTEQSDVEGAEAALRGELDGGPITGLEPQDDDGTLTVSFWMSTLHATLPPS